MIRTTLNLTEASLGEVCRLVTDGTHDTPKRVAEGYPLIKAKEIVGGRIDFETCDQISAEEHRKVIARSKPELGDTLFAHIGASLGEAAYVNTKREFSIKNIALFKPDPATIEGRYLYYLVISPQFQALAKGTKTGSAQPFLGLHQLRSHRIRFHKDLLVQNAIASILAAYDDLIETNSRRIELLEEMARAIYREWFVESRAPGVRLRQATAEERQAVGRDQFPEGWEVQRLGDHLRAIEAGKRPKGGATGVENGVPSIGAENIDGIGQHDYASEKFVPRRFFEQMRRGIVRDRDVALYKDGAHIGRSSYFRDGFPHSECCVNEHVFLLRASGKRLTPNALYLWLQEPNTIFAIRGTNANAAQPGVNQQSVDGLKIVVPDTQLAERFDHVVEPMLASSVSLAKRIHVLRQTRELLLPRLMSGELSVEDLEGEAADPAQGLEEVMK